MAVIQSLCVLSTAICSISSPNQNPRKYSLRPSSSSSSPQPQLQLQLQLRFHTSYRENHRYLKTLGIISIENNNIKKIFPAETLESLLVIVDFLKSKGFTDPHIQRLALICPKIFFSGFDITEFDPVFDFLEVDLSASRYEACGLILHCPNILFADVNFCLRPTLLFLRELGLGKLNSPTTLNANLLNTRLEKLQSRIRFLKSLGLSYAETVRICGRFPAIFGYSVENNLRPKFEYLVGDMERNVAELNVFPQYFAFSLQKRIVPRHLHLKARNVRMPLQRMLLWSDLKFYKKWK